MYKVLLFYKFGKVNKPKEVVASHKEVCLALQLKGRILIDKKGINGTVGGTPESILLYKSYMDGHFAFKNIDFKESDSDFIPFPKLQVRLRPEVITTGVPDEIDVGNTGKYITPDQFHSLLVKNEDIAILDMRNDYEWDVGRFKNAVRPPMNKFFELKDKISFYEQYKNKKIVMYCTGGIRCVPASAYFIKNGFDPKNVYQLKGGIVRYAEKYGDEGFFEGKCFVFDDRITIPVNKKADASIVGVCLLCKSATDIYRNCRNKFCNRLYLCCDECAESMKTTCQKECMDKIRSDEKVRPSRKKICIN